MLLISLTADKDSQQYWACIEQHPCQHDGKDLKKLSKDEYEKTMQCRVTRHLECIKTEIEKNK